MFSFTAQKLLRHRALVAVLAIAMLVAQAAGLLHKLDFEAHPAGITCVTCLAHGHSDTPLPTTLADAAAPAPLSAPIVYFSTVQVSHERQPARARGPPSLA